MATDQTLVLVNPKARSGNLGSRWSSCLKESPKELEDEIQQQVSDALGSVDTTSIRIAWTTETDYGSGIVRKFLQEGAQRVIVVGGDGTLSEAIQGFFDGDRPISPDTVLTVLPGGRGDDFFKALVNRRFFRGGTAWKIGLDLLSQGTPAPVDVGRFHLIGSEAKPRFFINIASFGFPGLVVQRVQAQKSLVNRSILGKSALTYGFHGATSLLQYRPLEVEVAVDGQAFFEGPIHSGFVLNGRYNAGGICWAPDVRVDDGLFHILVMEARDFLTTLKNTSRVLMENTNSIVGAHRTQGRKVRVVLKENVKKPHPLFEIDGDLFENTETRGAEFELVAGAIRFQMLNKFN